MKTEPISTQDPFVPRPQARREYLGGISDDTAKRWQDKGLLPPLIVLSRKVVGWRRSTLEKFLQDQEVAAQ